MGRGSLLAVRSVPCGGGRAWGEGLVNGLCHGLTDGNGLGGAMERGVCWRGELSHAGGGGVGKGEFAGDETCPCGGGRAWREGSLLVGRPVHAGEGERGERESAGDETCPMRGRVSVRRGGSAGGETCPMRERRARGEGVCWR